MLRIESLNCGYEQFFLKDISFEVSKGEIVGIIGPNGSGKTTLLRAITGVIKVKKGNVSFLGRDIACMNAKEIAQNIAVVSQQAQGWNNTVEEFVLLGRIPHFEPLRFLETKHDREIARECMRLTDTARFKNKLMSQMSQGERQLVLIARALAQQPQLLLLDEPTTHLDITHQVGIMDLIKRLNQRTGLTVLMVLHDLNFASEYCNRLVLLERGGLYKSGAPAEVLTYPIIEKVYNTVVVVEKNPLSGRPFVLAVPEEERKKSVHNPADLH